MSLPEASPIDPQVPSTSNAFSRRIEDNQRRFEAFCPISTSITLWEACRSQNLFRKQQMYSELRSLRGLSFETLLLKHKVELNDIGAMLGTSFKEICVSLRFFAYYRKMPFFKSNNPATKHLFELICNCIKFQEDDWIVEMNKDNLLEPKSLAALKSKRTGKAGQEASNIEATELFKNNKETSSTARKSVINSVARLKDREKVPLPPPPTWIPPPRPWTTKDDENLEPMHNLPTIDPKFRNHFEKIKKSIIRNNTSIRTKAENLSDIEYYGDNKILELPQFSLRLESITQMPRFDLPIIENDGYFNPACVEFEWYLYQKYLGAHEECCNIFDKIRDSQTPKEGFKLSEIHPRELYKFHMAGRHIHGFFNVWEEEERGWLGADDKWVRRRYLVDIYNHMMFPLYVEWLYWPTDLQWAFDKYSLYGLKLMSFIKLHAADLEKAGKDNFIPYVPKVRTMNNLQLTTKSRNIFISEFEAANDILNKRIIKEHRTNGQSSALRTPRKRKSNNAKEELQQLRPSFPNVNHSPQSINSPQKEAEAPKYVSKPNTIQKLPVQKENMDKTQMTSARPPTILPPATVSKVTPTGPKVIPLKSAMLSKSIPPVQQRPTPIAVKRRLPEQEKGLTPNLPPIKKKVPMAHDSWGGHLHFAADEEHIDETKESDSPDDESEDRRAVWVPQEQGLEPEQYAKMIVSHFPEEIRQNQKPPPPVVATPKTARRRKSDAKTSPDPASVTIAPLVGNALPTKQSVAPPQPAPSTSTHPTASTSSATLMPPPVSTPVTVAAQVSVSSSSPLGSLFGMSTNGHHPSLPPGKTQLKSTRVYASKAPPVQHGNRAMYPVKTLVQSSSSLVAPNGTSSVGLTPQRSSVASLHSRAPPGTPYYPASMRNKHSTQPGPSTIPHPLASQNQNKGIGQPSLSNGPSPSMKSMASRNPVQSFLQQRDGRLPGGSNSLFKDQSHPPGTLLETPESPEVALLKRNENIECHRVIPYNKQMQIRSLEIQHQKTLVGNKTSGLESRDWPGKRKTGSVPPRGPSSMTSGPIVQRSISNHQSDLPSVPYQPRTFSGSKQKPHVIPPISAPTVAPHVAPHVASSSNATERTVGVAKYRQDMPPVTNNRPMMDPSVAQMVRKAIDGSQLPTTSTASVHVNGNAPLRIPVERIERAPNGQPTNRTVNANLRKNIGAMSAKQLSLAIQQEKNRPRNGGDDGPSVKAFLLNLNKAPTG